MKYAHRRLGILFAGHSHNYYDDAELMGLEEHCLVPSVM